MSPDEQAIIDLTRENASLKRKIEEQDKERLSSEIKMRQVGVPSGYEDGNDWSDLSFGEQVSILCRMYTDTKGKLEAEKQAHFATQMALIAPTNNVYGHERTEFEEKFGKVVAAARAAVEKGQP